MISLRRVAVHNLKSIDLDLPLGKLIVFCGRSGSGKSSLALDTLYAEGQRRYIETFSPAMRQFLERVERPQAERLDGIPPAIAVSSASRKMDSITVGDATEVNDYLAMLFAQSGHVFCPKCSRSITVDTPQSVWEMLINVFTQRHKGTEENKGVQIAFAPPLGESPAEFAAFWKERGFLRGYVGDVSFRLDQPILNELYREGLLLIVDRLVFNMDEEDRFVESLETAFDYGNGKCFVLLEQQTFPLSRSLSCEYCNVHVPPLTTKLFRTDWIHCVHLHADINSPTMSDLTQRTVGELTRFFKEKFPLLGERVRGRTSEKAHHPHLNPLPEGEGALFCPRSAGIVEQIQSRLHFLHQVGLEYLTLERPISTLSNGEQRRIALTAALGSSLAEMLYVLDEPSLGLHEKDTAKLLEAILELRDRGNTVILVEHDKQLLQHADHIVELGPGAGEDGGAIVFQGSIEELRNEKNSLTGMYLENNEKHKIGKRKPTGISAGNITLTHCTGNNLKNITATFPLGMLCVVTGVSGAGKSSLIRQTLYPALCKHVSKKCDIQGLPFGQVNVSENINDIVLVDQTPMGRSSSSNPATYLKIFDDIRSVFAGTVDAKVKHITAKNFSFNITGGRCEHCKGDGSIVIDMQFLPDQTVPCPECSGKRYQQSVLDVLYRGKNIADVLEMTAREAFSFFRGQSKLQQKLRLMFDAGLDYLRLGQASGTLSGGEAQRLRLAAHLGQIRGSRSLILMDEPTAGLHFADVEQMLTCFQSLLTSGHSLIVIEHNEMVINAADYRIELGPGAGTKGGEIVAECSF